MELQEDDAQVCRLCGHCESIYIDVFGEEGIKRYLGLKIHSKINILVSIESMNKCLVYILDYTYYTYYFILLSFINYVRNVQLTLWLISFKQVEMLQNSTA